ncbi:MAG: FAD:protein FMN transferase [Verrucomicrobia bacterium]|nr:FAD:protein FMN transferase [Verrucomicrobiota bacterium]
MNFHRAARIAFGFAALLLASCSTAPRAALQRFEYLEAQMAVPFRIVLYAPSEAQADAAAKAAYARIAQLNTIMSDYEDASELSRLSRTAGSGQTVKLSDDLWRVLARAQWVAKESDGAFDVTCGPLVQLWRRARRQRELPDPVKLAEARKAVGYTNLVLDAREHTAKLLVPGMRLDVGGIAKGDAAGEALKVLRARGIRSALVAGSGDMAIGDAPPGKRGWRIELAPLDAPGAPPTRFLEVANCGFATSGDLFQRAEIGGKRLSHIVDPRTGQALTDHGLVVVITPEGITADSLSTTVSVLGPEKGVRFIERIPGAATRIQRAPGERVEVIESRGFVKFYAKD